MHATLQSHLSAQRTQDLRDEARRDARAREALTAQQTAPADQDGGALFGW